MSGAAEPDDTRFHLHGVQMYLGCFVLALSTFVVSLDLTIVNVILPHVASGFGANNAANSKRALPVTSKRKSPKSA